MRVVLPRAADLLLLGILREMAQGHAVTLIPVHAELTRQAHELGLGYWWGRTSVPGRFYRSGQRCYGYASGRSISPVFTRVKLMYPRGRHFLGVCLLVALHPERFHRPGFLRNVARDGIVL